MKYIEYINRLIKEKVSEPEKLVLFGQNIAAGSCLAGLTRNLRVKEGGLIVNTPNAENTLVGLGFGLMLSGVSSIFFVKQQDFLLLGIDSLADTYNFIRRKDPVASFTIVFIVVDVGYQGLQSSLNNFGDFCSMARISGFTVSNRVDAEEIIGTHLVSPGFRIIGVSQRLFGQELLEPERVWVNDQKTLFQYTKGEGATIACFNLSFPYGLELHNRLKRGGIDSSLFSVSAVTPINWNKIMEDAKNTKNIIVIDDSKSENLSCYSLLTEIREKCGINNVILVKRDFSGDWLSPQQDQLQINYEAIIQKLQK